MQLHQVLIKNFQEYLAGREVEATITLKEGEVVSPGESVLAVKDSIAAKTNIPVPRSKQDHVIGVEGTITEIQSRDSVKGNRVQVVKVKKS
jgi:hypothetical protein